MKRSLILFVFLIGVSLSTPDANLIILRHRHVIEQTLQSHTKQLTEDEMIMEKVAMYLRLSVILSVGARFEAGGEIYLNTS